MKPYVHLEITNKILLKMELLSPLQQQSETKRNLSDFYQNIQRLIVYLLKDTIWKFINSFLLSFAKQVYFQADGFKPIYLLPLSFFYTFIL